ncbi:MAG: acetyl-CoA carboxylase biotin carboxyl carrier protein [Planctomycetota bacterium]
MIDIRKLKELVKLMVENDLSELDLRDEQETVTVKRGGQAADTPQVVYNGMPAQYTQPAPAQTSAPAATDGGAAEAPSAPGDGDLITVESPMVGSFYTAANPDTPPFVKVGDSVSPGTVLCLVEAMKVFNEIKAESGGTIAKVCASNGDAVEFGQPLFMIRPS